MTRYECIYCRDTFDLEIERDRHEESHRVRGDRIHPAFRFDDGDVKGDQDGRDGDADSDLMTDGGQSVGGPEPSNDLTKWDEWDLLMVEMDCLQATAKRRFMEEWEHREDWKNFEARYHVYKAHDQLSVASYHSRQDDAGELVKANLADAVNHILMAMATLEVNHDACQPIQSEDDLLTDGGRDTGGRGTERRETHIDEDRGLWIPTDLREFTSQIVFRTPRATIQHFGSCSLDGYYSLIDKSHFGEPEEMLDAKNPDLAPDRVRIKPQGEESVELDVDLAPEIRTDGGQSTDDMEQFDNAIIEDDGSSTFHQEMDRFDADDSIRLTESQAEAILEYDRAVTVSWIGKKVVVEVIPDDQRCSPIEIRPVEPDTNREDRQ